MAIRRLMVLATLLILSACTVNLVQPYDADLYNNTEKFYKDVSVVIARGVTVSPVKSDELINIAESDAAMHLGHYDQFKADYETMKVEANALVLRALANSGQVDKLGAEAQSKIENAIVKVFPSQCDDVQDNFKEVSLTVRNYIDLQCLIGRWEMQHKGDGKPDITKGKKILKAAAWEGRAKSLYTAVLSIQKAEASKKQDKE